MDLARAVQVLLVATLVVAAAVKTFDARPGTRLPREARALASWLAAGFWLLTVGNTLSFPVLVRVVDDATTTGVARVVFNAAIVLGIGAVLVFFLRTTGAALASGAARVVIGVAAAVAVAQALLMVATPAPARANSVLSPGGGHPAVLGFYVVGGLWLVFAYARCGLFAARFARATRGALSSACLLITAGFLMVSVTAAVRLAIVLISASTRPSPVLSTANSINFSADSLGQTLAAVGLCVLGVLRVLDHRRRRRLYRELTPLRTRLHASFPEIALPDPHPAGADAGPGGSSGPGSGQWAQSYERCLVEVRDGLMRLSAPLNAFVAGRDPAGVRAEEIAQVIATATATDPPAGAGEATAASQELLEVLGGPDSPDGRGGPATGSGLDARAHFLAAVSRALPALTSAVPDPTLKEHRSA